jgi:hypothetical protein
MLAHAHGAMEYPRMMHLTALHRSLQYAHRLILSKNGTHYRSIPTAAPSMNKLVLFLMIPMPK